MPRTFIAASVLREHIEAERAKPSARSGDKQTRPEIKTTVPEEQRLRLGETNAVNKFVKADHEVQAEADRFR